MKKNKTIAKLVATATLAVASIAPIFAQPGVDCGCPALGDRTIVNLSTLAVAGTGVTGGDLLAANTVLTCDKLYKMDRKIYVPKGKTLTIKAGVVIKGQKPSTVPADATALIVSRGGKINAIGTETCPIIFTAEADQLDGNYSVGNTAQWGGIIILGKAPNNLRLAQAGSAIADSIGIIEGLPLPEARNHYGAGSTDADADFKTFDNDDNSGIMQYVSIRHGGTNVSANNEINGLTLGSVGRGTTLEHIEVVANEDDGIEFFGGNVNLKWATVMFCKDDYFDWDQGYTGKGQFWFGLKLNGPSLQGDHGFEIDGDDGSNVAPISHPIIYNATMIGNANANDFAIEAKERTEGEIYNSIFTNYVTGVRFANVRTPNDAYKNWQDPQNLLIIKNCSFDGVPTLFSVNGSAIAINPNDATDFAADGNVTTAGIIDYGFAIDGPANNNVTDKYFAVPSVANSTTTINPPADGFFSPASYRGAFQNGQDVWVSEWTYGAVLGTSTGLVDCPTDFNNDGLTNTVDFLTFGAGFAAGSCE